MPSCNEPSSVTASALPPAAPSYDASTVGPPSTGVPPEPLDDMLLGPASPGMSSRQTRLAAASPSDPGATSARGRGDPLGQLLVMRPTTSSRRRAPPGSSTVTVPPSAVRSVASADASSA